MKHLYRIGLLFFLGLFAFTNFAVGQVSIIDTNPVVIDFTGFEGAGFATSPAANQLDADNWATTGFSDGAKDFGIENTSGDHARGSSSPSTTGGIYGVEYSTGDQALIIRPGGSDFTPGTLTLRIQNNTGQTITSLDLSYDIIVDNDNTRGNSWNFAYSIDNSTYTAVEALDYTSADAADAGYQEIARSTTISGLSLADGAFFYLQWQSDDVSGSGSRDELGIDDISITASTSVVTNTIVEFESTSATVSEGDGTTSLVLTILNEDAVATTVDVVISTDVTPTADATDIDNYTTQSVTFPSSDASNQSVIITLTDDVTYEGAEVIYFELTNISGGNNAELGSNVIFELTIEDNDPLPTETLPYVETFDSDLNGVLVFSVASNIDWEFDGGVASANGYGSDVANDDWLITPAIDLTSAVVPALSFTSWTRYADSFYPGITVSISTDYSGTGDPSGATWTPLSPTLSPEDSQETTESGKLDLSAYNGQTVYVAFRYTTSGTGGGSTSWWQIDDLSIAENPILPEPTNHIASFAAVAGESGGVNLTWSDNDGTQAAENFLIKMSDISAGDISDPVDGTEEADDATTANVASGVGSYFFTGLAANTEHFFKIYPYTNTGSDIDYKTDATVPSASVTTANVMVEDFSNFPETGTSYYDGTFTGNDGSTWTYVQTSGNSGEQINAPTPMLGRNRTPDAEITSGTISGGIGTLNFDYQQAFGSDVNLEIYVNEVLVTTVVTNSEQDILKNSGDIVVNVAGDFVISFRQPSGAGQVSVDNLIWTPYEACTEPTTQASSLSFSDVMETDMGLSWTRGDGNGGVLILAREGGPVDAAPTNGISYVANAAFGSGDEIGVGNHVVYNGTGTDVTVSGLIQGTDYHFALYEYNATDVCYLFPSLTGSQATITPNDQTTDITALASPIAQTDISSLADTDLEAVDVFGFTLTDEGTDGVSTFVDGMVITAGTNNSADWTSTIAGAVLSDGTTDITLTVDAGSMYADLSSAPYELSNNTAQEFTLSIWLNTSVTDGDVLEFEIGTSHLFSATVDGSLFLSTLASAVTSAQHTIDVEATAFDIDASSTVGLDTDFSLTVSSVDENGNVDVAARTISLTKTSGVGNLTGTGLTAQAMTDGLFEWSDLQLDAAGDYVLTVDDDGTALTQTVDVTAIEAATGPALLLISEVAVTPTAGEFIEIYNASESTVALGDYYLTDATFAGSSTYYYNIVTGSNAGGGGFNDFNARFPAGASIEPGEAQTIAIEGSEDFFSTYGIQPTYELYEDGIEADAIPDMREAFAGSIDDVEGDGQGSGFSGLSSGEVAVLYYWDGQSDLVTDIDYVVWGDKVEAVDKTGITIDGPDAGTETSTYLDEIAIASQDVISAASHADGNTWSRIDFDEGTEVKAGGNGVGGNDETSENLSVTFIESTPNPGSIIEPGSPLIMLNQTGFNGSFGFIENGQSSDVRSYVVTGTDLVADLTITPPIGFEIAAETEFSTAYSNGSPWVITPVDGSISQTVYVRFSPLTVDASYLGDIAHESTEADTKTIAVSGQEGVLLPDLFFSEYLEGSVGTNKALEIYNGSGEVADLTKYQIQRITNGGSGSTATFEMSTVSATMGVGAVIVIANSTVQEVLDAADLEDSFINHNGDDVYTLLKDGIIIDIIGENSGVDPGDGWEVAGVADGTKDHVLVRKPSVSQGNPVALASFGTNEEDSEWIVLTDSETSGLGSHGTEQEGDPIITIASSLSANFGVVQAGSTTEQAYSVSAVDLLGNLTITAPSGFLVSTDASTFTTSVNLSPTDGTVESTTITVQFAPDTEGEFSGSISHESTDALTKTLAVSGTAVGEDVIYFENFSSCDALNSMTSQSISGDEAWECTPNGETGGGARMNGYSGGAQDNLDWLITPAIDLSTIDAANLSFNTDVRYDGPALEVYASSDYTNDADAATWTKLTVVLDEDADNFDTWTSSGDIDLSDYTGSTVYIGFLYSSNTVDGAATWSIDNVKVAETLPFLSTTVASLGDFNQVDVGAVSANKSFTVKGFGLTADVIITPPAQFEVSTASDFATKGTSSSPLEISPTDGAVDQQVFVRFAPTAEGSFSGNVTVESTGFDDITMSVSGAGVDDEGPALGLDDGLDFVIYPNPVKNVFEINNHTGKSISVEVFALDGAKMAVKQTDNAYDISSLNSGVYVIVITDENSAELAKRQIIKE